MTIALGSSKLRFGGITASDCPTLLRIVTTASQQPSKTSNVAYLCNGEEPPPGFPVYLVPTPLEAAYAEFAGPAVFLPPEFDYLTDQDVIRLNLGQNRLRVLFRRNSPNNSLLVTERCNNFCLMCSQPPKVHDDTWIAKELLDLIPMIDPSVQTLGLTGGEPTLLGPLFLDILKAARDHLPRTQLHVLSNGRTFADIEFARKYVAVGHPALMVGIPIYSDTAARHDYVVQGRGAFDETVRGILNLKRLNQKVEIRVVIHKQTYERLPQLAEFIARNLTFVNHVALMGLEMTGFTLANQADLWIDSFEYQSQLAEAVEVLTAYGLSVSVYNHQLCVIPKSVWPVARKSISDWKNNYLPECEKCGVKDQCGGFFSSGKPRYSQHIKSLAGIQS